MKIPLVLLNYVVDFDVALAIKLPRSECLGTSWRKQFMILMVLVNQDTCMHIKATRGFSTDKLLLMRGDKHGLRCLSSLVIVYMINGLEFERPYAIQETLHLRLFKTAI
ncbi:hypothetical protein VTP01DRAFT_910 [Rhizomucor pusillus]|uniref:uncharacterized protein n=1 Tax=Rhizomucor pusillus TaxID=4840 RepID=UPI003743128E